MAHGRGPTRWLDRLGLRRPKAHESVRWEIEHHLSELVDQLIVEGWSPDDARAEAERRFGGSRRYGPRMRRVERRQRAARLGTSAWDTVRQSAASLARRARRRPAHVAAIVITLGLGLGANATMFGIVDRLLLSPPEHIRNPDEVRRLYLTRPDGISGRVGSSQIFTYPDYLDFRAHEGMAVAAYSIGGERTLGQGESASRVRYGLVSASFFGLLGATPHRGRFFADADDIAGVPVTAVISYELWQRAFGGDEAVLGRIVSVDDWRATVVGIAPPGFTGVDLGPTDVWMPIESAATVEAPFPGNCLGRRGCWFLRIVARLHENVGVAEAESEATALHVNARREMIEAGRYSSEATVTLAPLAAAAGPNPSSESSVAKWLMAMSLVVLLIAAANVANLLLARTIESKRETAVRLALGSGRGRVIRESVLETMLLALAGGLVALGIARWGGSLVRTTLLPNVLFPASAIDTRVVAATVVLALLAGLVAGLGPAIRSGRTALTGDLSQAAHGGSGGVSRLRGLLTTSQATLSVILLVSAGLFIRSLGELRALDLGLDVDRLVIVDLDVEGGDSDPAPRGELYEAAARSVAALPEVESVAGTAVPFGSALALRFRAEGVDSLPRLAGGGPYLNVVTSHFFETAGLEIVRGRALEEGDGPDDPVVVVVSETMARMLWPNESPLGRCVLLTESDACASVVGVAEDAARYGFDDEPFMAYYLPMPQSHVFPDDQGEIAAPNALYVRTRSDARRATQAIATAVRSASPQIRWARVDTLRDRLDPQARSWRLGATMFTLFGLLALSLAGVGLYGVLSFDVAQRTRELGIRTALGAERARLLGGVLLRGARYGALGVGLGLLVAAVAAPYAQDLLFQVSPRDPSVLGGVTAVLLVVTGLASFVPGLRATRVDAATALRAE